MNFGLFHSSAFLLALSSLFSRLLGLYRVHLLASIFGAGTILDAYFAAFRLPDLVFNIFILGTVTVAFIPIFSQYLDPRKQKQAEEFFSVSLNA